MTANQAVLTGDLIASTQASPEAVDRAMAVLAAAADEIAGWRLTENTKVGDTHFTRFRGDGWQIIVSLARFGLKAALLMYARLAADPGLPLTRVAVGISTIDRISGPDLSDAYGAAFAVSGRALGEMERGERLRADGHGVTPRDAALIALLNDRISDWSAEQAEAIAHVIAPDAPTQAAIAGRLGISPQALSYRLTGARWPTLKRVLAAWEEPEEEMP
ncbi:MAG: hypothetical protein LCH69_11965 [Proteobacteria bacterium]|nr:hypothetical protein [Pseudomonadota bacterium]